MESASTTWVLVSAALVFVMTPGLALFYGGMTRAKGVLNMMMLSFGSIAIIGVLWALYGYSMAFGQDIGGGLLGNPFEYAGLQGVINLPEGAEEWVGADGQALAFVGFQAMFAILTVALISGAIADRVKFGGWMLFAGLWATIVYFPVAHWVFAFDNEASGVLGGWIANGLGAVDFAGGTAVHINAGAAALALALVLGPRIGFGSDSSMKPHNLPLVMLGSGILWLGWFGFNAGSSLAPDGQAAYAFVNTIVAPAAAIIGWLVTEKIRDGHSTTLGAASGAVAGLVAITPACTALTPIWSIILGLITGVAAALAVGLKFKWRYDDSLDVVGVHLVGGLIGTLFIGLAASPDTPAGATGLFYGGGFELFGIQLLAAVTVLVYSFVISFALGWIVNKTVGFRATKEEEITGVDLTVHAESAYDLSALPALSTLGAANTSQERRN